MKLNFSFPATGCQKLIEIEDEKKVRMFYDKRMSHEMPLDALGDEWKGYRVRISGGNDKDGFPMKQGVLTTGRVRLLLSSGHSCYRPRRAGERKRKSVRGCIVNDRLSVLNLVIIKKGEKDIPGLTDRPLPRRLGPKRASKIRRLFNLSKEDDVRQYVVKRPLPVKEGKPEPKRPRYAAPKIQRLITPLRLQRKRHMVALRRRRLVKRREDAADYAKLLAQRLKEAKERKAERRRTLSKSRSDSTSSATGVPKSKAGGDAKMVVGKKGLAAKGQAVVSKQQAMKTSAGKQQHGKAAAGKQQVGKATAGKQQQTGKQQQGKAAAGKQQVGKAAAGKQQQSGKQQQGKAAAGKQQQTGKQQQGKATAGKQQQGKAAAGKQQQGKAAAGKQQAGKAATGDKQQAGKQKVGKAAPAGKGAAPGAKQQGGKAAAAGKAQAAKSASGGAKPAKAGGAQKATAPAKSKSAPTKK